MYRPFRTNLPYLLLLSPPALAGCYFDWPDKPMTLDPGCDAGCIDGGADGGSLDTGPSPVDGGADGSSEPERCTPEPMDLELLRSALAVGDFDRDGKPDLAIGEPFAANQSGRVCTYYGSTWNGTRFTEPCVEWTQSLDAEWTMSEPNDRCGAALAAGDFDGDGTADLAIGCPGETVERESPIISSGLVTVLFGREKLGLNGPKVQVIEQNLLGKAREAGDRFGSALAAIDLNADGASDLAIGAPGEDIALSPQLEVRDCGVVNVVYGQKDSLLDTANAISLDQEVFGAGGMIPGLTPGHEDRDGFGDAMGITLAAAELRFGTELRPTLLIGAPGEQAGRGTVLMIAAGTADGLKAPTARAVISVEAKADDFVGATLSAFDDHRLFVGAPGTQEFAGALWAIEIDDTGAATRKSRILQSGNGANGLAEPGDLFASSLAKSHDTLLIGVVGEEPAGALTCDQGLVEQCEVSWPDDAAPSLQCKGWTESSVSGFGTALAAFEFGQSRVFAANGLNGFRVRPQLP